jgi:GTPase SAR1 family protein
MASSSTSQGDTISVEKKKEPVVIITIGMAGSGKTTFVQRINSYLHSKTPPSPPYIVNLDPAVTQIPFEANIDIRDTVDYQEVMKRLSLLQILTTLSLLTNSTDIVLVLMAAF